MKEAVFEAQSAESGICGEPQRRFLRGAVALYLDQASAGIDLEIQKAAGRSSAVESWIGERLDLRNHAAAEAGAEDQLDLYRWAQAADPDDVLGRFETGAMVPLDDRIATAARDVRSLVCHASTLPFSTFPAMVRRTGGTLGLDLDASGPLLLRRGNDETSPCGALAAGAAGERGVFYCGASGGPGGLRDCLQSFGDGLRSAVVRRLRGAVAWTGADKACSTAAGVLFRRLALNPVFTSRFGPGDRCRWLQDVRYQEAISPRKHWARLQIALRGTPDGIREMTRIWSRATGEALPSEAQGWLSDPEPAGADLLRGEVLGGLLEDALMTRFGRDWFENPGAGRFLQEIWEADPDETAESLASSLGLGTIDPVPIIDLFRP